MGLAGIVPAGVVTGSNLLKLMEYCRDNQVALPGNLKVVIRIILIQIRILGPIMVSLNPDLI